MKYAYIVMKVEKYSYSDRGFPIGIFFDREGADKYAMLVNELDSETDSNEYILQRAVVEVPVIDDIHTYGTDEIVATAVYAVQKAYSELLTPNPNMEGQLYETCICSK